MTARKMTLLKLSTALIFDWTIIENQFLMWSNLLRVGKRLKFRIFINYVEDSDLPLTGSIDKRGKSLVTRRMLAERDTRLDAECTSGVHMIWRDVYRVMCCPGRPCRNDGNIAGKTLSGKVLQARNSSPGQSNQVC